MIANLKIDTIKILRFLPVIALLLLFSCKKKTTPPDDTIPPDEDIINPVDPTTPKTVGFFLDNWAARNFTAPTFDIAAAPVLSGATDIVIDASEVVAKVPSAIFGQNSVSFKPGISTHTETMNHLKVLKPTVIRFPGGSIADYYFFNRNFQDKPGDAPDVMMGGNGTETDFRYLYWYGKGNDLSARANLDDYYALLEQTGSQGSLTVNYGYARYGLSNDPVATAAKLAADWVKFDNGRTKYWTIGNENYGSWEQGYRINTANNKDGQPEFLSGTLYAQHVRIFIREMKKAAAEIGKTIYIGVPLVETQLYSYDWLWQNSLAAREWNKGILEEMKNGDANTPDFYELHNYYINNNETGYGAILNSAQNKTGEMAKFLDTEFKRYQSPAKPIVLGEYNILATGSAGQMQQVSFVNGMHTTIVLGEAIKNNFGSAIRWDLMNGWEGGADHGMFDDGKEPDGRKGNPRPVFYYMYYFQKMFGDRMLKSTSAKSTILSYASSFASGQKGVVLVNKNTTEQPVKISVKHAEKPTKYYWYVLTGGTDNGDFSRKVLVNGVGPEGSKTGGPLGYATINAKGASATQGAIHIMLPARSVVYVVGEK